MRNEIKKVLSRPKALNYRTEMLALRMTPSERDVVIKTAKSFNLSISEYFRRLHRHAIAEAG